MAPENTPEAAGVPTAPEHSKGAIDEEDGHSPFPIVGIGASAGGLEAFRDLLAKLPADTGMAFVLVQHLDPHQESRLTELLSRATAMPVLEASHGLALERDHVYVIPPNSNLAVAHGHFHMTPRSDGRGPHLPVDYLFRRLRRIRKRAPSESCFPAPVRTAPRALAKSKPSAASPSRRMRNPRVSPACP